MTIEPLLRELHRVAAVPGATERFKAFILAEALQGKLTAHEPVTLGVEPLSLDHVCGGMAALVQMRPRYRWTKPKLVPPPQFETPQAWLATELANTGLFINGIAFKPSDWVTSGRPIIRIQNLSGLNRDYNYANGEFPDDNLANPGDLLVSWSATLDTYLWQGPQGVVNQHIFKVIPNLNAVTPRFLYWLLKHEVRQLAQSQHAHGLAMMHINRGPFLQHAIRLPPLAEQHRIVAKVDELMALCDQLELAQKEQENHRESLRSASLARLTYPDESEGTAADVHFFLDTSSRFITGPKQVAAIRQTILDLAIQGRLVPQDAGEQAFSELLPSIHQHRNQLIDEGKARNKRRMQAGGVSYPNDLPSSWISEPLGELVDPERTISYGVLVPGVDTPDGVPFVRAQDLSLSGQPVRPNKTIAADVEKIMLGPVLSEAKYSYA